MGDVNSYKYFGFFAESPKFFDYGLSVYGI